MKEAKELSDHVTNMVSKWSHSSHANKITKLISRTQ